MVQFQRARSEEQREQRRQAILRTAAGMLTEMPVADVGLNELARRVGLAKSNVLRYFESLEAVLLELMGQATRDWLAQLIPLLEDTGGDLRTRRERLVTASVATLLDHPVLCDLFSTQAGLLERNISPDTAAAFKRAVFADALGLADAIGRLLPELTPEDRMNYLAALQMTAGALWTHSHPSAAVLAAYAQYPDLAAMRLDFESTLTTMLRTVLKGLLAAD